MNNIQKITDEVSIKDWSMKMHMSMTKKHILKNAGTLIAEGTVLDSRQLVQVIETPVKNYYDFGKPKVKWFLNGLNEPEFKTIFLLIDHYNGQKQQP